MKKENLNKENFWNEAYAKYPDGVQVFCDWIDRYKKENHWRDLFNGGFLVNPKGNSDIFTEAPKFHDIPLAMQAGILQEFFQCSPAMKMFSSQNENLDDWKVSLASAFKFLHENENFRNRFKDALNGAK